MHSSPLDELSALSPLLLPLPSSSSPPLPEFGPYLHSVHSSGSLPVDPSLSSASSGLLLSSSSSTSSFAPQHFSFSQPQQRHHYAPLTTAPTASAPLSSPAQIVSRLLELERNLQYLSTTAYCHPILTTGLNSQFYVIKYAMHALSAEEKKLAAWQQRRQRAADRRQQRIRVKRETNVKSEEDEVALSMRGEGEADPSLSMMVSALQSRDMDDAIDEQQQEEEEQRQAEMHEARLKKAELRHVGEWINAQLAALHAQVQAQMAHYPSPPSSPPPPPPAPPSAPTSSDRSAQLYPHPQHRSASGSSAGGASHFRGGGGDPSFSSSFHSTQYPTASTPSTGSAHPTYSAPTSFSFPPPPLDKRSVSTGSNSSLSSPITPPPASHPPPLFATQSLPVWSSGAGGLSPMDHAAVYRKIERHDSYASGDGLELRFGPSPLSDSQLASLPASVTASVPLPRAEHSAQHPPHPASSQSLGAAVHSSTASRASATLMHTGYSTHSHHFPGYMADDSRDSKHRYSHSDEFAPTGWAEQHTALSAEQRQPAGQYREAEGREGGETGRQRKRGGSRRRKRDNNEETATVYAFPRAPQSIFPRLPSEADNPHELPPTHNQHRR